MSKWVHRLRGVQEKERIATCEHCGPVCIIWHSRNQRWVCAIAKAIQRGKDRGHTAKYRQQMAAACEICCKKTDLIADTNHLTARFRGTLCRPCNSAIGLLKDNIRYLENAILYLKTKT